VTGQLSNLEGKEGEVGIRRRRRVLSYAW